MMIIALPSVKYMRNTTPSSEFAMIFEQTVLLDAENVQKSKAPLFCPF